MALTILNVENEPYQDGLHLKVTLDQAPTGALEFYANPRPGAPEQIGANLKTITETVSPTVYKVKVRTGLADEPGRVHRMPYYLIAVDDNGASSVGGEWLCAGLNTDWLSQTDQLIQDILTANVGMLDRSMMRELQSDTFPSGRDIGVRKIYRGQPNGKGGEAYPRISHQAYSITEDYLGGGGEEAGLPYSDYVPIQSKIEVYAGYQAEVDWSHVVRSLGMGVFNILNQPHYVENVLDCGLKMFECRVGSGNLSEYFDANLDQWLVSFTMQWSGNLHAGKYHPSLYT